MSINKFMSDVKKSFPKLLEIDSSLERLPIDLPGLSHVLGGGIPLYRMLELYGPESSGKTAIATYISKTFIENNQNVLYIDLENGFDLEFAKDIIGLDVESELLAFLQPSSAEETFSLIDMHIRNRVGGLIIIDSVAAMPTREEMEKEATDASIGVLARIMSRGLKRIIGQLPEVKTTIVWLNQVRSGIGTYSPQYVTPGGNALKFYSSIRLEVRRKDFIGTYEDPQGIIIKIKASKNKTTSPFKVAEISFNFAEGFDMNSGWIDLFLIKKIIIQSGAWFSFNPKLINDDKKYHGKVGILQHLLTAPELFTKLKVLYHAE